MKQYIVDAFTDKIFSGNPAAVCVLDNFPSEEIMQSIAAENNLSETAFAVKENDRYHIRWFTPKSEIDFAVTLLWLLLTFSSISMLRMRILSTSTVRSMHLPFKRAMS